MISQSAVTSFPEPGDADTGAGEDGEICERKGYGEGY